MPTSQKQAWLKDIKAEILLCLKALDLSHCRHPSYAPSSTEVGNSSRAA